MHTEPRVVLQNGFEGFLLLESESPDEGSDFYSVKLTEVSRSGLQFRSQRPIPTDRNFSLTFITNTGSLEIVVTGNTRWNKQDSAGTLTGCALSAPMPESVLQEAISPDQNISSAANCRRSTERIAGFLDLDGFWAPATLKNYSSGGFCLETHHVLEPATQLCFVVEAPQRVNIFAHVEWRMTNASGGYVLGCSYQDSNDASHLDTAHQQATTVLSLTNTH